LYPTDRSVSSNAAFQVFDTYRFFLMPGWS